MNDPVTAESRGAVALLRLENPPVNALSSSVSEALKQAVSRAERDHAVAAIVITGGGRGFSAGADVRELEAAAWDEATPVPEWHALLEQVEDCPKPVVMALHGSVLGAGLELAMAGHFRVALPTARFGQPEVNLGITPGGEGTQRLPRLVGVPAALEWCLSGRTMTAAEALGAGLIDALIEGDLVAGAMTFADDLISRHEPVRATRTRDDRLTSPDGHAARFGAARQWAANTRPHETAPLAVIAAIEAGSTLSFADGCRRERALFTESVRSEQAKALIHGFRSERAVSKVSNVNPDTVITPVKLAAVVGAGQMGTSLAVEMASIGITVLLSDATQAAVDAGMVTVRHLVDASVTAGHLSADAAAKALALIRPQTGSKGFEAADIIIEAASEDLALKMRLFADMDVVAKPECVLASTTSTFDIDEIAGATWRAQAVIGLHFLRPAIGLRVVEIVRGRTTSPEATATAMTLARRLGKIGIVVANGPGFLANRVLSPYLHEARLLVEEGTSPEQVDRALAAFGMTLPLYAGDKPLDRTSPIALAPDTAAAHAPAGGAAVARPTSDRDIVDRAIYAMINAGALALGADIAARASDVDVIATHAHGFPGWRGGPMFHADRTGLRNVVGRMRELQREHGDRWEPAPLLLKLADAAGTFRDWDRGRSL